MHHPLARKFRDFAESECKGSSPLYQALSGAIAEDEAMLDLAAESGAGQPVPNLFLAAVHFLLASGDAGALGDYYASRVENPRSPWQAFPVFRDFVLSRGDAVASLLRSRLVQTNEVRRSSCLYPAFLLAASFFPSRPWILIEIGTSAGFNLLWDRYGYRYDGSAIFGDASSPVVIDSSFSETVPAVLGTRVPEILHRIGIDLNVIDVSDPDQVDWLRALVWPEHSERRKLLDDALKLRREVPLDMREGDGFGMIEETVKGLPEEALICVYHTHVANQIPEEARSRFVESIARLGSSRDLVHVSNNIHPHLHLTIFRDGQVREIPLAQVDGHARWIRWLAEGPGGIRESRA